MPTSVRRTTDGRTSKKQDSHSSAVRPIDSTSRQAGQNSVDKRIVMYIVTHSPGAARRGAARGPSDQSNRKLDHLMYPGVFGKKIRPTQLKLHCIDWTDERTNDTEL